jgi:2-oxo-3-hexenedioate decarboxylase
MPADLDDLPGRLIAAFDSAAPLDPITAAQPDFTVAQAYDVLALIEDRRRAQGWRAVGRKIGFTNRTLWPRYGVYRPMWAHTWEHSVHHAKDGRATLPLAGFMEPRLEPEVVFHLKAPLAPTDDALEVLAAVDWIAPGFEIVQSPFPGWKFQAPDCTAACGLHGALVVGAPFAVTAANRAAVAAALPAFEATLYKGDAAVDPQIMDRGLGANVLDSPALALATLSRVLADQPRFPPLAAGETVTTGTLTDAWPVAPGETWSADYGGLGLEGLTVTFE